MAVTVRKYDDGYSYVETIAILDQDAIRNSKITFEQYMARGIIDAAAYDAPEWYISDGVRPKRKIDLQINEVHFQRECVPRLGCSLAEYQNTMRVMLTSFVGMAAVFLIDLAREIRRFADKLEDYTINYNNPICVYIEDFLELLPGESAWREQFLESVDTNAWARTHKRPVNQRTLANYQSYFKFDRYLQEFWKIAAGAERLLYFPVCFWWELTAILPLRPIECVVTPRDCLRRENGKSYLTIRRTRIKGRKMSAKYSIEKDFSKCEYQILEPFADKIEEYIAGTSDLYDSCVDTLFCKRTQFYYLGIGCDNGHYTYSNLCQCLRHFYEKVLVGKYGLQVLRSGAAGALEDNEIEKICLGDTRHIAMISLMVSGGSATVCKELAGHNDVEIGHHYYSNIRSFLDVLSLENARQKRERAEEPVAVPCVDVRNSVSLEMLKKFDTAIKVDGGYCMSEAVAHGDFTPCGAAIDAYGYNGVCAECRFFVPRRGADVHHRMKAADEELHNTVILLKQSIESVRRGLDSMESIECAPEQLRAKSIKYVRYGAMNDEIKGIRSEDEIK